MDKEIIFKKTFNDCLHCIKCNNHDCDFYESMDINCNELKIHYNNCYQKCHHPKYSFLCNFIKDITYHDSNCRTKKCKICNFIGQKNIRIS